MWWTSPFHKSPCSPLSCSRSHQQRTLEQISDTTVPQVVEELVEVFTVFSQDRVQQRFAELIFQTLAISLAEKIRERARSARHMLTPCGRQVTWKF